MTSGKITDFLLGNGWTRSDATPDELGYCDAITDRGSCERAPRWFRWDCGSLCATHARQTTEHRNRIRAAS